MKMNNSSRFNAMSIPIDNIDMAEAVERIVELIYRFPRERKARYVATVNVDFIVNALGVAGAAPRHPELLEILRSADLVTADGFPVVLLSRLMGVPLKERVTGADLVPALAQRCAEDGLRMYFLGGREEIAVAAARTLEARYPGLEVVGVDSPTVHTQGAATVNYEDDDARIIDSINRSGADILLLGLGNPKQEQWFRRNEDKLKVPVSIGVGGTFEFIAGTVKRAPEWMQRNNLEWLYRISQDPARLWKRYAQGLFKLAILLAPLMLMRARELLLTEILPQRETATTWRHFTGPNQSSVSSMTLPRVVNAESLDKVLADIHAAGRGKTLYLIDFSACRRIEIAAMQSLFDLARCFSTGTARGVYVGLHKSVRKQLRTWRLLDLFDRQKLLARDIHQPLAEQRELRDLPIQFYSTQSSLVVYLHGDIDGELLRRSGLESVLAIATQNQRCIIDLRYADLIETSAIVSFHRLATAFGEGRLSFAGVNSSARRMFRLAQIPRQLDFVSDEQQYKIMVAA